MKAIQSGNSIMVYIPLRIVKELNINKGDILEAEVINNRLVITNPIMFVEQIVAEPEESDIPTEADKAFAEIAFKQQDEESEQADLNNPSYQQTVEAFKELDEQAEQADIDAAEAKKFVGEQFSKYVENKTTVTVNGE